MKDVVGFEEQYSITEDGMIWSHKRGRWMSVYYTKTGYKRVTLRDFNNLNKARSFLVHRLVAQSYIPNPEQKPEVNHVNCKRDDNRVENLEWATRSENNQHAWDHGNKVFVKTEKFIQSVIENAKIARAVRMAKYAA
jgi:hypothetical protein